MTLCESSPDMFEDRGKLRVSELIRRALLVAIIASEVTIHGRGQSQYHRCFVPRMLKQRTDLGYFIKVR